MKKGSLVVVGSGIKSIGHLTIETQGWIKYSDVVLYCVADPATEIWIKENSRYSIDLYQFYGNEKRRLDTYIDMADAMLKYVREGKDVCGVFYGHPGVFVYPSHRAIGIARSEGYKAAMLPAISALDCLFADIGVDPSTKGSQTVEATDLLLRKRRLTTDGHVVIWQIGCVGDLGFNFSGYDNRNLNVLIDYLETFYDKNHDVIHYQGSQYPMCPSIVEKIPLHKLRTAAVTGISTLYIAPQEEIPTDTEMAFKLGLVIKKQPATATTTAKTENTNGTKEVKKTATTGSRYYPSPEHSGLATFIGDVSENPMLLAEFMRKPELTAATYANLTSEETKALLSKHQGRIRMAIKQSHLSDERIKAVDATLKLFSSESDGKGSATAPAASAAKVAKPSFVKAVAAVTGNSNAPIETTVTDVIAAEGDDTPITTTDTEVVVVEVLTSDAVVAEVRTDNNSKKKSTE